MRFRPPKPVGMTLNLAPLVDVMMCLIIFFLLASRLVSAQHRPLQLAHARAAPEIERGALGSRAVVNVRPTAAGPAEYVVYVWDGQRIVERSLTPTELAGHLQRRAATAAAGGEDLRCVVRADRDVTYGDVEAALRACGLARITRVVFSVDAGEEREEAP